jgi:5-methylcytosine-specific restriction enzyme subunit McrC
LSTTATTRAAPGTIAPHVIPCAEQGLVDVPLVDLLRPDGTLALNPEVEKSYFSVSLKARALTLKARSLVGLVPLNERVSVFIQPRVDIGNLTHVVEVSEQPGKALSIIRGYETDADWRDSLLDLYASTILRHLETIAQRGLWREYERREGRSSFPHGRILVNRTTQLAARGIHHAAYISWFERTADTQANRCLKYAVWLLAQRYLALSPGESGSRKLWGQLNAVYPTLSDAALDHERRFLGDGYVRGSRALPTLRDYYREALDVAVAIIEGRGVLYDGADGGVAMPSLAFDMDKVFEGYVRNVIKLAAASEGWGVTVHNADTEKIAQLPLFDTKTKRMATPDVVLLRRGNVPALIGEIKNVPRSGEPERGAIEQAVTYALRYRTRQVVIFTPCREEQSSLLEELGTIDSIRVLHCRVDLSAKDLIAEEAKLTAGIKELI